MTCVVFCPPGSDRQVTESWLEDLSRPSRRNWTSRGKSRHRWQRSIRDCWVMSGVSLSIFGTSRIRNKGKEDRATVEQVLDNT